MPERGDLYIASRHNASGPAAAARCACCCASDGPAARAARRRRRSRFAENSLALAVAEAIVRAHGGTLRDRRGASERRPRADRAARRFGTRLPSGKLRAPMPHILVVDDEPGVRESLRMLLKDECDVDAASASVDARARAARRATPPTSCCSTS